MRLIERDPLHLEPRRWGLSLMEFPFGKGYHDYPSEVEREELEEPSTKGGRHEDHKSDSGPSDLFGPCRMRFGWGWQDSYRAGRSAGHLRMPLHLQPRMVWKEVDPKKALG